MRALAWMIDKLMFLAFSMLGIFLACVITIVVFFLRLSEDKR